MKTHHQTQAKKIRLVDTEDVDCYQVDTEKHKKEGAANSDKKFLQKK